MQMIQPNKCRREFELVIIGGGCSGLSLALALCRLADKPDLVPVRARVGKNPSPAAPDS